MVNKSLRILFAPLSNFISHTTRCISIASELKKRGHIAEFISGDKNRNWIEKNGFRTYKAHDIPNKQMMVAGSRIEYMHRFRKAHGSTGSFGLKKMAEDDLRIYSISKPSMVICDSRPTASLTALMAGIPCMMIKNCLGYVNLDLRKKAGLMEETEIDYTFEREMSEEFAKDFAELFHNNKCINRHLDFPLIIPGIPELEITGSFKAYKSHPHRFVGPIFWHGWQYTLKPKQGIYENKTVILVTLGSSFPFKSVVHKIVKAFDHKKYSIIINGGDQDLFAITGKEKINIEVLPYISIPDFLKISDVIIHHGGHGTTMDILKAGKPSIVFPFNGDQIQIAKRIEDLQCGKVIRKYPDDISPAEIKKTVTELLMSNLYQRNAKKIGYLFKQWDRGAEKAASFIEEYNTEITHRMKIAGALAQLKNINC